jgi:cytochrome P450 family 135
MQERYGDVFTVRPEGDPWVIVGDPELIRQVFAAPTDVLHAGEGNRILTPLFGPTSLPLLDGEQHIRRRRLLMPPLQGARLTRYKETIAEIAAAEIDRWSMDEEVSIWPRLQTLTLGAILRVVLGDMPAGDLAALGDAMSDLRVPAAPGQRVKLSSFESVLERPQELIDAEVDRRRRAGGGEQGEDVLSLLRRARYEDGSPLSAAELRNELTTLLVAGHETTSTTLAWALEFLTRDRVALDRAAAEATDEGGPFTDAVVRETLRLRPPLPFVARHTKQPFRLGAHSIPEDVTIMPSLLLVHHRPDVYPDPFAFRPERFLERKPETYTWIPFGGGTRRCIGSHFALFEMRVVLSTLLERVTVRAARPGPEEMRSRATTLTPAHGVRLILERSGFAPA